VLEKSSEVHDDKKNKPHEKKRKSRKTLLLFSRHKTVDIRQKFNHINSIELLTFHFYLMTSDL
jgi:hypothetical protein